MVMGYIAPNHIIKHGSIYGIYGVSQILECRSHTKLLCTNHVTIPSPIATILTGICLWTTNVSDIIMYHCHNISVSVTNLCLILNTYSAQSVNGG